MSLRLLSPFTGEFLTPEREATFQEERLPETVRHVRLVFLASVLLNTLFLVSDWRFYGQPHFYIAVPARLGVVLIALLCFWIVGRTKTFSQAQKIMVGWEWANAIAVAALVSSHSDLALFAVLMLPSIYYLAVPTSFRWSAISGAGCSLMMLAGYLLPDVSGSTTIGLLLGVFMLNFALALVTARSNRLQRMEWCATQAERRTHEELETSRLLFETMFKTVPVPLVVVAMDGRIVEHNEAAVRFFGASPDKLRIETIAELYVDPSDRDAFVSAILEGGQISDFETRIRCADGSVRTVLLFGRLLDIGGEKHIMSGVVDITERKSTEERIWRMASHDALTGLSNRALFQSRLEQAIAQAGRNGTGVALLLVNLDHLNTVNSTLGHAFGDEMIKETARRLSLIAYNCDVIARLEADEFVIVAPGTPGLEQATHLAERIRADLGRPYPYEGHVLPLGASIGIAGYPEHDTWPSDLMKDADLALQAAKAAGGEHIEVYAPALRHLAKQKTTAAQEIREALRQGQIVPFYQPKIDLGTGQVAGFEALARWRHPVHGVLAPGAFLAAFEDGELSITFGEYMIRHVAEDIRNWIDQGIDCGRIAVNLSTTQFSWVGLAKRFLGILQAANVPVDYLEVEITETVFLGKSTSHVISTLKQFQAGGIKVALDDFGTGYASLIHLKQFPIDSIKIDRSFVKDLHQDESNAAIALAVIKLGTSLGLDVVAEGVETPEQAAFLRQAGCKQAQGHLYAYPMAAGDITGFLGQRARCA
jgi:diguanylate cyclase (GGDEF)-like protein/PAS domain S-box-containing protein